MSGRHVVFLESNLTGSGYEALAAARRAGHRVTFLTRDLPMYLAPGHERLDLSQVDEVVTCETNDPAAVVTAVRGLDHPADAIVAVGEWHMISGAEASRTLGLPGPDPAGVRAARDKSATRRLCAAAGVPVPGFARVEAPEEVYGLGLAYPCVVKPLDDGGSNGVRLCRAPEDAADHVRLLLKDTHNERGQRKIPAALVEEYVDGPEVSVEVLVRGGVVSVLAVTFKELGELPYFCETGHHVPAALGSGLDEHCAEVAARSLAAVGFDFGAAHVELRLAADGPRLIEINCRPAGDRITRLVALSTGVDIPAELVAMHLDPVRPLPAPGTHQAAAVAFLPAAEGVVSAVAGAGTAARLPGVVDVALYVEPGTRVPALPNNTARYGHVVAVAPTGPQALRRAREAADAITVTASL
ncbi:ATP-grasp domain-containing protein [Streptomyces sp. MMG1533]|uniref:ATP-grasp domain-containing protein n=1 Tax=Streptomyces sp. MMG1533 TaxID=1415546 RepID=UPI0003C96A68|nr:ATP-grasp domain-containing protein [Streptomyces sp. MMG1533]AGZ94087.1 argininosuccinate lyase domain protein [Streptomyces sp. MMG1533]